MPRKVLVASGGHKEYLSPLAACEAIAAGLRQCPEAPAVELAPMADGGDGLIDAAVSALNGKVVPVATRDPLFRPRSGRMGIADWHGTRTALIESAEACGAALLAPHERQTMVASSHGLGEMMLRAVEADCRRLVIGLGGSIVTDCGLGMAQALGLIFLDDAGREISCIGNPGLNALNLAEVASVRTDRMHCDFSGIEILVACDVDIPLLGPGGQARTFGPQKYANAMEIEYLERGLANIAAVIRRDLGREVDVPMAGAAGGIAAGLMGFLGARLQLGAELVASLCDLEARIRASDTVVIGEGRLDDTTLKNKAPHYVGTLARRLGKRVIAVVGTAPGAGERQGFNFFDQLLCADAALEAGAPMTAEQIANSLTQTARSVCRYL